MACSINSDRILHCTEGNRIKYGKQHPKQIMRIYSQYKMRPTKKAGYYS